MHHLLLEVVDSFCSNVFGMVCLISHCLDSGQYQQFEFQMCDSTFIAREDSI